MADREHGMIDSAEGAIQALIVVGPHGVSRFVAEFEECVIELAMFVVEARESPGREGDAGEAPDQSGTQEETEEETEAETPEGEHEGGGREHRVISCLCQGVSSGGREQIPGR
jgi:hypothetical protein